MNYQIKVLSGLERGNYVILITRGSVDARGVEQIFNKIIDVTRSFFDCRILIDSQDSTLQFLPLDVVDLFNRFDFQNWPRSNKIALVSSRRDGQYQQASLLGEGLLKMKIEAGWFCEVSEAVAWLSGVQ